MCDDRVAELGAAGGGFTITAVEQRVSGDHVRYDFRAGRMECDRCGASEQLKLPMSVQLVAELSGAFIDRHEQCAAPSCPTCKAKLGDHHASTCSAGRGQVLPSEIPGYVESIAASVVAETGYRPGAVSDASEESCACDPTGPCLEHEPDAESEEDARIAEEQMEAAQQKRPNETHTNACWARIAWGDGKCECGEGSLGCALFVATRRPHQRGTWALLREDEKGHFERAARSFLSALGLATEAIR